MKTFDRASLESMLESWLEDRDYRMADKLSRQMAGACEAILDAREDVLDYFLQINIDPKLRQETPRDPGPGP